MKKLFLFLVVISALCQGAWAEDLPDTVWTRSFEPEDVIDAKFSPDDSLIYVATSGGVYSVETKTGNKLKKFYSIPDRVAPENIYALEISPNGEFIAVAYKGIVTIINTITSSIFLEINTNNAWCTDINFSSDGNELVYVSGTGSDSTHITILNLINKEIKYQRNVDGVIYHCLFTLDSRYLIYAVQFTGAVGRVIKFAMETFTKKYLGGHSAQIQDLKISPDGRFAATAAWDSTAKVWDIETGKVVLSVKPENIRMNVTGVDFSKDSKYLVTGSGAPAEQNIKIWDMKTGNSIYHYKQNGYGMIHVSNNNKFITTYILSPISKLILLNAKWSPTSVIEGLENKETEIRTIPTPFSDVVKIEFNLPKPGMVQALISNETGENVFVFPEKFFSEGKNTLEWKPQNLAQGIYFCTIKSDDFFIIVKLLLQK